MKGVLVAIGCLPGCVLFRQTPEDPAATSLTQSTVVGSSYGYALGYPTREPAPGELQLAVETTVFLKNLELSGNKRKDLEGETFVGFLAPMRLRYGLGETTTVELGAVLGHNFGDDDGLDVAEPLVRLVVQPSDGVFVVGGTLVSTHWIHEALLDDVKIFRESVDQGLQLRVDKESFKGDYWLNWRVRERDDRREQFEVGLANQVRIGALRVDGQAFVHHQGGQQNSLGGKENNVAALGGLSLGLFRTDAGSEVRLSSHALWNENDSDFRADNQGRGIESRLEWTLAGGDGGVAVRTHVSHFSGEDMRTERGDPLYTADDYSQLGASALFDVGDGVQIETALVLQLVESELNYTFQIYVTAAEVFSLFARER